MKGIHPLLKLLAGVLAILGFAFLVQHTLHGDDNAFHDPSWDPKLLLKQVVVVGWNHGEREWQFSSDELSVDHQGRFLTYKGKGVGVLMENNKPVVTVWAPKIRYDMVTQSAEAAGGVILKAAPHIKLEAGTLFWNPFSSHLYIPGKVFIQGPDGKAWAHHLLLVAYQGKVEILGVHMDIRPRAFTGKTALPFLSPKGK